MSMHLVSGLVIGSLVAGAVGVATHSSGHRQYPSADVKLQLATKRGEATCSGVYIGDGMILTAKHCTSAGTEIVGIEAVDAVYDVDGNPGPRVGVWLEWASEDTDVAVYHVEIPVDLPAAQLACRLPQINEPVALVGNPFGLSFIHTSGYVAGLERDLDAGPMLIPVDARIAPGMSGGPVYAADGKVIGLIAGELTGADTPSIVSLLVSVKAACDHFFPVAPPLPY